MTIQEYIATFGIKSVKAPIMERWNKRVVPRKLNELGKAGASIYLESYGKGISSKKIIELAHCALSVGATEMAMGFGEEAYKIDNGNTITFSSNGSDSNVKKVVAIIDKPPSMDEFPKDLRPGMFDTMQAVDAKHPREYYIENAEYIGQPKRDGNRDVMFVTPYAVFHQSRSTSIMPNIGYGFEGAMMHLAELSGPFILDGERYYLSYNGDEHRTAAQAAEVNIINMRGDVLPITVYAAFKAVYFSARDLRYSYELDRCLGNAYAVFEKTNEWMKANSYLNVDLDRVKFEFLRSAVTKQEKQDLVLRQQKEGREGEVWTKKSCLYSGGKAHHTDMVRTKYIQESRVHVDKLVPSTVEGHAFSALEVSVDGVPVGSVGTGWTKEEKVVVARLFNESPDSTFINVTHQGWTTGGKLWHARA